MQASYSSKELLTYSIIEIIRQLRVVGGVLAGSPALPSPGRSKHGNHKLHGIRGFQMVGHPVKGMAGKRSSPSAETTQDGVSTQPTSQHLNLVNKDGRPWAAGH